MVGNKQLQLFLCHSHKDKKFVTRLAGDLTDLSVRVWLDAWELTLADSISGCIRKALQDSVYVGVVLSPDSVKSRWCKSELEQALTKEEATGERVIIPLLYRRVRLPPYLEDRLYANFSRSYMRALAQVASFIHALDTRKLMEGLDKARLKRLDDVKALLRSIGWKEKPPPAG